MEQAGLMERVHIGAADALAHPRRALPRGIVRMIFAAATGIDPRHHGGENDEPVRLRARLAAGTMSAGGTLGLIPHLDHARRDGAGAQIPVTDLFAAAIIPGIMLAGMYAAYA